MTLRLRGSALEASAEAERREQDQMEMHVVTAQRLKTLAAVGAGSDVLAALSPLLARGPMRAEDLNEWLERELGHVRAQEKLEVIRRYTLAEMPTRQDSPEEREAAGAKGKGPSIFDRPETPAPGSP